MKNLSIPKNLSGHRAGRPGRLLGFEFSVALLLIVTAAVAVWLVVAGPPGIRLPIAQASGTSVAGASLPLDWTNGLITGQALGDCPQLTPRSYVPLIVRGDPAAPGFGIGLETPCLTLLQGSTGKVGVAVAAVNGSADSVALSVTGTPSGIGATIDPATVSGSGNSALHLQVDPAAVPGTYALTISGRAGSRTQSASLTLIVVEPLEIRGKILDDAGSAISGAQVNAVTEDGLTRAQATSDAGGAYHLKLPVLESPAKVLVTATLALPGQPAVSNGKWQVFTSRGAVQMETIALPNPAGAEMTVNGGRASTADQSLVAEGLPANVSQMHGRVYDPDADRPAFPGEFAENGQVPLNSAGFLWAEAMDGAGVQVSDFGEPVTMRQRLPEAQWPDLEDIVAGTDRIDVPMYTYDEQTQEWTALPNGWLEDGNRMVLPEDTEPLILSGTFTGDLYAVFTTTHFSWMNVDYAYIGPWTLSRMTDTDKRNNDCLYDAMQLAKKIALSAKGRAAYAKVNLPGSTQQDLEDELADGKGPEIVTKPDGDLRQSDGTKVWGQYTGDAGGAEDQFEMNEDIWAGCGEGATADQKKNTTLRMATNILHETAHWKDDVKKHPSDGGREPPNTPEDTPGEEGTQLEEDLFGGNLGQDGSGNPTIDPTGPEGTRNVTRAERDAWLDPDNWPPPPSGSELPAPVRSFAEEASPLEVTIALTQTTFALGEEIPVSVTYKNVSASAIKVPNRTVLEAYPVSFVITNQQTGTRVRFLGPEIELDFLPSALTTLAPGQSLTQTVHLVRDPHDGALRYQLIQSGVYSMTAVYRSFEQVPRTTSNSVTFTLLPGGSVSGTVSNAVTGAPIAGATIRAVQNGYLLTTVTSGTDGRYLIPELPPGSYTLEARALAYRRISRPAQVAAGTNTTVDLRLSPLSAGLSFGQTVTGTIEAPGEVFRYTVGATAGDYLLLRAIGVAGDLTPHLEVVRPDGSRVCADGTFSSGLELSCQLDASGTHTIRVADYFGNDLGTFGIHLQRTKNPIGARPIAAGETLTGSIAVAPAAGAYTFNGSTGERILVRMATTSGDLDPNLAVYRPDGTRLCDNATFSSGVEEECTLDASGTHTILAADYLGPSTGSYGLFLQRTNNPAGAVTLSPGQTISRTIVRAAEADAYTFSGTAGQGIVVRMAVTSGDLDPNLTIYRPDGTRLCSDATFSSGLQLACTLDAGGAYTILVADYLGPHTGAYGLFVQSATNPSNATPIVYGETKTGTITSSGEADAFTFSGSAGERILVRMATRSGDLDPSVGVYRPDGTRLCDNATFSSGLEEECTLDASGTHTILAADYLGPYTGSYGLFLQRTNGPAGATAVNLDQTVTGNITTAAEMDAYSFSGTAGQAVVVEMAVTSGNLDPLLAVYRPDGTRLCGNSTFSNALSVACTPSTSGTHTILAADYSGPNTGAYTMTVSRP